MHKHKDIEAKLSMYFRCPFFKRPGLAGFVSPFLCEYLARRNSSTFISANQKELADAALVTLVPLSLLQFAAQVVAVARRQLVHLSDPASKPIFVEDIFSFQQNPGGIP